MKTLLTMAAVAVGMYLGLLALLWWGQEKLLFHPHPLPAEHRFRVDSDVHEAWVDVPGARLHALHLRLPNPRGVVFFLHGNAGNLDSWFSDADFYRRENMDLFMLDYRGYGKSSGRIASQEQLLADVRAAWAHVQPLYAGKRRVIYGRSLGSGLAAMLAAEVQPELTVLVSPYFSMGELAREHYPWVPSALLRYPLATHEALARVQGPVLLAHGGRDTLIPPTHSQRLHQVAPHASLLHLPEGGHNDLHLLPAYAEGLSAALQR
ncbi:MAG TPA: alpha/beta fold hydrolase [Rubrivivax sp.]|nr:alpha/beta fold hydrolase [Rubrivivax sp.]